MRGEWRRDFSNIPFFLTRDAGRAQVRSEHGDARPDLVVGNQARSLVTEAMMFDLLMVALTIVFFVIAVAYVAACERLE